MRQTAVDVTARESVSQSPSIRGENQSRVELLFSVRTVLRQFYLNVSSLYLILMWTMRCWLLNTMCMMMMWCAMDYSSSSNSRLAWDRWISIRMFWWASWRTITCPRFGEHCYFTFPFETVAWRQELIHSVHYLSRRIDWFGCKWMRKDLQV